VTTKSSKMIRIQTIRK